MTNYEKLLKKCDKQGIKVKEVDFNTKKKLGYWNGNKILLNSNNTDKEKYCILAEELGHLKTTYGNITTDSKNINNIKQEFKARRWGHKHIVSLESLIEAFENNCTNIFDIAEYLDVTDNYLNECLNDYKQEYGTTPCRVNNYSIFFEPHLGILKMF